MKRLKDIRMMDGWRGRCNEGKEDGRIERGEEKRVRERESGG